MTVALFDVVEVIAEMALGASRVLNVYHLANVGDPIAEDEALTDVAEVLDGFYALVSPVLSSGLTFVSVLAKNLTGATDLGSTSWPTMTVGGSAGGGVLPFQNSGLITFPTETPKVRGRKFLPGLTEDAIASGLLTSTVTDALLDMGIAMLNNVAATSTTWRYAVKHAGSLGILYPTAALVQNVVCTLGRRKPGVGE